MTSPAGGAVTRITRIHPPVPARYARRALARVPDHDPVRARQVVHGLSTVAGVAEECAPLRRRDVGGPRRTGDLDCVTVGCWGSVVQITDPAFGEDGVTTRNMDGAFEAQVESHPEARVIGVCEMDFSLSYLKYLVRVPGVAPVRAEGWDDIDLAGDPVRTLRALGITPGAPGTAEVSPDDLEHVVRSDYLDVLSCGLHHTYADERLTVSVFKVARPDHVRDALEAVWCRD
ncbi:DUF6333 family protein [Streptomyces sp. RS10V-4]|uniref:DUF6333 family protein n=1 Tax=Streptomyces rhizoryzae TaxID=2932493 RepID=UPI00200531CC|nr:DUF6333 family protein [Streptomyces rhizoryzae]MCK7626540.1 DUF6333 family protein [Streptomyces rhizoryzae]